jgi:hexulose-6-phosphate isomerase
MTDSLDRRDFLAASGTALAIASLASSVTAADVKPKRRFLKSVKSGMVRAGKDLTEKFQLLADVGFDGVDVSQRHEHDEVLEAKEKSGLTVHGVVGYDHWKIPLSHPDLATRKKGLKSFIGVIEDAHAYGATSALLVPAVVNKEVGYKTAYENSQEMIREAIPVAAEKKIKILFENVWNNFLLSPVEMARYVDEFESKWVGVYFDVGNIVRYGWPEHWIVALGNRIGKIDVKEYSRKLQNSKGPYAGFKVKIGEGDCDWPAVVKALESINFRGWCTAEVGGGDRERMADIKARMDRVLPG